MPTSPAPSSPGADRRREGFLIFQASPPNLEIKRLKKEGKSTPPRR